MDKLNPRVCGTETELAVRAWDSGGRLIDDPELYSTSLHALPSGVYVYEEFMPNAGRYYMDMIHSTPTGTGGHIEICTPECGSIDEAVIYEFACEEIVLSALDNLLDSERLSAYDLRKRVSDEKGNYWGSHENYLTSLQLDYDEGDLYPAFAAHLATRNTLVGAGRVSRKGFNVAQKTWGLKQEYSWSAHTHRPLVDLRHQHETLTTSEDEGHRIQVSSGDANVSPWALRMRLGTTALILRMIEEEVYLGDLALEDPLKAAFTVAHDDELSEKVTLSSGKTIRPIRLQQELAYRALALSKNVPLPAEEVSIIQEWTKACDDSSEDPEKLKGRADWATKKYFVDKIPAEADAGNLDTRRAKDFQYDRLGESDGLGMKMRDQQLYGYHVPRESIEIAMHEPPQTTRATLRGQLVRSVLLKPELRHRVDAIGWEIIEIDGEKIPLKSRATSNPIIQKLIDYANN